MTEWWTNHDAALIGAIAGSSVGIIGAAVGTVAGCYARKGAMKALVLGLLGFLVFVCGISLITGIVAVVLKQPYHVWYPLVLIGFIGAVAGGCLLPVMLTVYRQAEHRRFEAEQIRRA